MLPLPIVVGVDGSATALTAVRWAAFEAARTGAAVHLTHVCDLPPLDPRVAPASTAAYAAPWTESGRRWLRDAADLARWTAPGLDVDWDVHVGAAADTLVARSAQAGLVVLGSRGLGGGRDGAGSVAAAVSASAACPVVVVREGTAVAEAGQVVVGTDGSARAGDALAFGFEAASARGVPLVAVRAWRAHWAGLAGADLTPGERAAAREREGRELSADLTGWREKYPRVRVAELVVEASGAAEALLAATSHAQLLVVGCGCEGALGSAARELVHEARCPVAVVRPRR
ncbi:hypothetical protein BA062_08670 [Prauserella flavalba]|uniref:UspA domain-containing protein n=1 Tax=Prauserella flavalba TaxID=1477506 RepID=A0A318LR31_9PSEU|nr:hypothetical protein BA062_08670 [Prauserella flavalba]